MTKDEAKKWLDEHVSEELTPAYDILQFFTSHSKKIETSLLDTYPWICVEIDSETSITWNGGVGFEFPEEALYALWKLMGERDEQEKTHRSTQRTSR